MHAIRGMNADARGKKRRIKRKHVRDSIQRKQALKKTFFNPKRHLIVMRLRIDTSSAHAKPPKVVSNFRGSVHNAGAFEIHLQQIVDWRSQSNPLMT
jgi:hypothetical protein